METIFEIKEKRKDSKICEEVAEGSGCGIESYLPHKYLRKDLPLPNVSELDVVRHYTKLSQKVMCVDTNFYPLGSCTMKYNPKINESLAQLEGFRKLHPYQGEESVKGILSLMYELERMLCEIGGMDEVTLQPAAGAHGEFTGLLIIREYLKSIKEDKRKVVLIPDSAHGTNPASSSLCGFKVKQIKSDVQGLLSLEELKKSLSDEVSCLMITNPNTLGLFEREIERICEEVHKNGALVYMDGANLNALVGLVRPGDFGVDVLHYNLHKTFSTPHGGGGPGAGPIGVKKFLSDFLPVPRIEFKDGRYSLSYNYPKSIGKVKSFYGNVGVLIKAFIYIRLLGIDGLKKVSQTAVLNANYLASLLKEYYEIPYPMRCMHEFVISVSKQSKKFGVRALDIAKRLIDYGFHPPTIYFPLIVQEAMMIEPTETESKETLDRFAQAMIEIAREIETDREKVKKAPHKAAIKRADEVRAAKEPILTFNDVPKTNQPPTREQF